MGTDCPKGKALPRAAERPGRQASGLPRFWSRQGDLNSRSKGEGQRNTANTHLYFISLFTRI